MKKKLAMLITSLFLVLGTAWAQVDYTPNYPQDNNNGRKIKKVQITSSKSIDEYSLTDQEKSKGYLDLTSTKTFSAKVGEELKATIERDGDWTNAYVYIDKDGDGFTAGIASDGYSPTGDLVSYSFYSGNDNNDDNGHNKNSAGQDVSRNTMDLPKFKAPSKPGVYRMRFKMDWNSIDPAGDTNSTNGNFTGNGGRIIDVMLQVEGVTITAGKRYALQEATTGLFLDVQTLGIKDGSRSGDNISLNSKPCIVYFEASGDKWKIKNVNGKYISKSSDGDWNPVIGDNSHDWIIAVNENGCVTIAREIGKYINADAKVVGSPLYNDKGSAMQFNLIEYNDLNSNYCVLKSPTDTYLNFTEHASLGTAVTFQSAASELYITPSAAAFYLESKGQANTFVGSTHQWNATTDFSLWTICKQEEGKVFIARNGHTHTNASDGVHLGSNDKTVAGTGIFTNVPESAVEDGQTKIYIPWIIEEKIDCPTTATTKDGKLHFKSNNIWFTAPCNTLRFTLTKSGAFFQNGKNRMSLDEFKLYDANGQEVELAAKNVTGNNNKTYGGMFDGVNSVYAGTATWNDGTEDDYFEISLPKGVDLKGAFSFSFVTENTQMDAKEFRIDISYKKLEVDYELNVTTPNNETVTVKYGEQTYENGATITLTEEFNLDLFVATEIQGYVWNVVVDENNRTMTLTYTKVEVEENPEAVVALVNRIGGEGTADNFKFVLDPSINSKQETFVIGSTDDGLILIKGTTISAITTGLGWYLNNIAHINIAWNSLNEKTAIGGAYVDLSNIELPLPAEETHTSDAKYRYYLNYCTFGYSMTSWTWKRWQQEIDWMALHGINMPLQIVGLEEVWRKFLSLEKYKYTAEEAKAFVPGPAFTAWWGMNNLEGWGGTSDNGWGGVQDDAWYQRQQALATQILDRQRALGMQPVLPGFSGMVPSNFASKTGVTTLNPGGWGGFTRPHIIAPGNEKFAEIAKDYYQCLEEVMGTSKYYSMDPFHEGAGHLASVEGYATIYDAMETAQPGSQWVIQQWQWDNGNQKLSLQGVPAGKLIVLDLFSDGKPEFDAYSYNGYAPQDAVFCVIPNFGGRSGLMGRLNTIAKNYFLYKDKHATIKGIGAAPEAIEQTPVTYDLLFQLPWMNGQEPDVKAWVEDYAIARYGKDNRVVKDAWELLREGVLNYGTDRVQGPVEDVWAARPNLDANKASSWGTTLAGVGSIYTPARRQMLIDAVYKLIEQEDELALTAGSVYESNYLYDLVEFGGAVMADYAYDLLLGIKVAKNAGNTDLFNARKNAFLQLILDMDAFRGTNLNFRLGKWTQEARDAAKEAIDLGATTADEDWYEFNNARTIITTWGDSNQNGDGSPGNGLKDYSYRSWQGLLADYYYPRWKYYFEHDCTHPGNNAKNYFYFEWNWAHGMKHEVGQTAKSEELLAEGAPGYSYSREPEGNTIDEAKKMLAKYIIPVKMNDGTTYYAYRTLTTDLTNKAPVTVIAGSNVNFAAIFDLPADVTGTITINNGDAVSITQANVTTGGPATMTLTDGTELSFNVEVKEIAISGFYHISYDGKAAFIGYNADKNDDGSAGGPADVAGYKMIVEGRYSTDAEADKVFAIYPKDKGYAISAQGKFLKSPNFSWWNHVMFSDSKDEAGVYVFHGSADLTDLMIQGCGEKDGDIYNDYLQVYGPYSVVANNPLKYASNFTLTPITTYPLTIPSSGVLGVCLPFNVVLPQGVEAYDINDLSSEKLASGYDMLSLIASAGETLKAGTPAILKATPGAYDLTLTIEDEGAKTSLQGSVLHGSFVKTTLSNNNEFKTFILNGDMFELVSKKTEVPANTCWVEAEIKDDDIELEPDYIEIDAWKFRVKRKGKGIVVTDCVVPSTGEIEIAPKYKVDGEMKEVIALADDFLYGNEDVTRVALPATLTSLGSTKADYLCEISYYGYEITEAFENLSEEEIKKMESEKLSAEWVGASHQLRTKIYGSTTWRMTVEVNLESPEVNFNKFGSCLLATKELVLQDDYSDGSMQLYLQSVRDNNDYRLLVFKLDTKLDVHTFKVPANSKTFTFILENDGSGGYMLKTTYEDSSEEFFYIEAKDQAELHDFMLLHSALPKGINVNVKFEELYNTGLFVGCTKLQRIDVDPENPNYMSCDHGVLYNKSGIHVLRFPEGGGEDRNKDGRREFETLRRVTRVNAGALHDVDADIYFHSNPSIQHVAGHEGNMKATYHLIIDDDAEVIDFVDVNENTFVDVRYIRELPNDVYGTIMLPFAPDEQSRSEYVFYEFLKSNETSLTFTEVEEPKANVPYLFAKRTAEARNEMTAAEFTVKDEDKPIEKGVWRTIGSYITTTVVTNNEGDGNYYYGVKADTHEFVRVKKKITVKPYRAYFVNSAPTAGSSTLASTLKLHLADGSTTEISPEQVEGFVAPIYYDLQGRRVLNPTNGVYIVNGKKVVVK